MFSVLLKVNILLFDFIVEPFVIENDICKLPVYFSCFTHKFVFSLVMFCICARVCFYLFFLSTWLEIDSKLTISN